MSAVHQLTDEQARLDALSHGSVRRTVRDVLSSSCRALPADLTRLSCLLGLHPGTELSFGAAAALAHVGKDRYRRHDLVRVYAAEMTDRELPTDQRRAASIRVFSWYLHSAAAAGRILTPGRRPPELGEPACPPATFDDQPSAVAWCETERTTLAELSRQALAAGEHTIAWQLPGVLWPFFHIRKHWDGWLSTHEHGLRAAELAERRPARTWLLDGLAWSYIVLGRSDEAVAYAAECLAIHRELGDRAGEAAALGTLGASTGRSSLHRLGPPWMQAMPSC